MVRIVFKTTVAAQKHKHNHHNVHWPLAVAVLSYRTQPLEAQNVIWLLSTLALPLLLYKDPGSSVDKHMPAAASTAGGPYVKHRQ